MQKYALHKLRRKQEAHALSLRIVEMCDQRIARDARKTSNFAYKGDALKFLKRYKESLEMYNQAIQLDPSGGNYAGLIAVLWRMHRYRACWQALTRGLQRSI